MWLAGQLSGSTFSVQVDLTQCLTKLGSWTRILSSLDSEWALLEVAPQTANLVFHDQ